jgi:hypothetical protein
MFLASFGFAARSDPAMRAAFDAILADGVQHVQYAAGDSKQRDRGFDRVLAAFAWRGI